MESIYLIEWDTNDEQERYVYVDAETLILLFEQFGFNELSYETSTVLSLDGYDLKEFEWFMEN